MATVHEKMTAIANAIRAKSGKTGALTLDAMAAEIMNLGGSSGGQPLGAKLYSFGVLSDIHIQTDTDSASDNLERALTMFDSMGINLVCAAGDIADHGQTDELERFKSICDAHPGIGFHTCTGNHDKPLPSGSWENTLNYDRNHEIVKDNDVFLFMSLDEGYESSTTAYTNGIAWLRNRLERYRGSRIFLFMHFPISGYSGLLDGQYYGFSSSATQDEDILKLLNQTKNVTVFHGHTHYQFDVESVANFMNVYSFTASNVDLVHVPSSAYCRDEAFDGSFHTAQAWVVDVYEKGIALKGCDVRSGQEIADIDYLLPTDNVPIAENAILIDTVEAKLYESESVQVAVTLAEPGNATVTVSTNNSAISVSPASLTFTASNYNVPQYVTITAPDYISDVASFMVTYSASGMVNRTTSVMISAPASRLPSVIAKRDNWYKGSAAKGTITEINFVNTNAEVPETYTETWDASEAGDGSITGYRSGTIVYVAGNGSGRISVTKDADYMFSDYDQAAIDFFTSLKTINGMNLLETSQATDIHGMFYGCTSLESVDVSSFDTSNVTLMNGMFYDCRVLNSIDLSNFDTSKVEDMHEFCYHADVANPIILGSRFTCENVVNMEGMFKHCHEVKSIDLSMFNTSNVENMNGMIKYCYALETITTGAGFTCENVTDMTDMFTECTTLKTLDLSMMTPTKAEIMVSMFQDCTALETLQLGSNFNTPALTDAAQMFDHCDVLTTLDIRNLDTRNITASSTETDSGLYRFARKAGIQNLIVGPNFVQDYNMAESGSSGMFRTDSSTPLTITGANAVLRTYNFSKDNRTVTFTD